jgi:hypothetical protein
MATSTRRQDDDNQKAQGQGRVAAGGHDDQGHPLTRDGHVDHRIERGNMQDDDNMNDRGGKSSSQSKSTSTSTTKRQTDESDEQSRKLTKDGHVDKRTVQGRMEDDDDMMDDRGGSSASRKPSASNRHANDASSQGHVAAGGYDDDGNPLTKDGHVDKRVKAAHE